MTKERRDFDKKFQISKNTLYSNNDFIVSLRPKQPLPFSLILSSKTDHRSVSKLSSNELTSMTEAISFIEDFLLNKVRASEINYYQLMMFDKLLHWHVIPRYKRTTVFGKLKIQDPNYPYPVDLLGPDIIEVDELLAALK